MMDDFYYVPNTAEKYLWLVGIIHQAGRITLAEIQQRWLENKPLSGGIELLPRTFHKWVVAVKKALNVEICCERRGGYHYYINNVDDLERDGMARWLLSTASVQTTLFESQSLRDRIMLEAVPSGEVHLTAILDAMRRGVALMIQHQGFYSEHSHTFEVHPYALRLFKQRWYMVALSPALESNPIRVYGLDRIHRLEVLDERKFVMPHDFDVRQYFSNCYGVVRSSKPELVRLRVYGEQVSYVESLPLHSSQRRVAETAHYSDYTLWICPEFDFQQAIFSMADTIEVLAPQWLRDEIKNTVGAMAAFYADSK